MKCKLNNDGKCNRQKEIGCIGCPDLIQEYPSYAVYNRDGLSIAHREFRM